MIGFGLDASFLWMGYTRNSRHPQSPWRPLRLSNTMGRFQARKMQVEQTLTYFTPQKIVEMWFITTTWVANYFSIGSCGTTWGGFLRSVGQPLGNLAADNDSEAATLLNQTEMGDLTIEIVHLPIEIVGASIKLKVLTNKNGVFFAFCTRQCEFKQGKIGENSSHLLTICWARTKKIFTLSITYNHGKLLWLHDMNHYYNLNDIPIIAT